MSSNKKRLYIILGFVLTLILLFLTLFTTVFNINNKIFLSYGFIKVPLKKCNTLRQDKDVKLYNYRINSCSLKYALIGGEIVRLWRLNVNQYIAEVRITGLGIEDKNRPHPISDEEEILILDRLQYDSRHTIPYSFHSFDTSYDIVSSNISIKNNWKEISRWQCIIKDGYISSKQTPKNKYKINLIKEKHHIYLNVDIKYLITENGCKITGNIKHSLINNNHIRNIEVTRIQDPIIETSDMRDITPLPSRFNDI